MIQTDTQFYEKYNTEYNQVLLKELQSQEDTGSMLPEDIAPFNGCMYEPFGEELEYIKAIPNNRVWTIIDNNEGRFIILTGRHLINRVGYLVTDTEWQDENEEYLTN